MTSFILPALALVVWSLFMWIVMYLRRIPAMTAAGVKPDDARHPGSLNILPSSARAAADNYNHLHEQPVIFYALCFILHSAPVGGPDQMVLLAWGYVAARVAHSMVQITFNAVAVRFGVFALSSILLMGMAGVAASRLI